MVRTRGSVLKVFRCGSLRLDEVRRGANVGDVACATASKALLLRVGEVRLFVRVGVFRRMEVEVDARRKVRISVVLRLMEGFAFRGRMSFMCRKRDGGVGTLVFVLSSSEVLGK